MIFYNFGERIVESLVVNSANWLWGPLPFREGLGNIAVDSWNALVQLGIDQWNFWLPSLPPLPPFPFAAQQAQAQLATGETLAPADQSVAPPTVRPHPLRDALAALRRLLAGPDLVAPQRSTAKRRPARKVDLQEKVDLQDEEVLKKSRLQERRPARKSRPAREGRSARKSRPARQRARSRRRTARGCSRKSKGRPASSSRSSADRRHAEESG